jgi:hypothetical protein
MREVTEAAAILGRPLDGSYPDQSCNIQDPAPFQSEDDCGAIYKGYLE